jgi:integrase
MADPKACIEANPLFMVAIPSFGSPRMICVRPAATGVRPGEGLALKWTDIDFANRKALIERAFFVFSSKAFLVNHASTRPHQSFWNNPWAW